MRYSAALNGGTHPRPNPPSPQPTLLPPRAGGQSEEEASAHLAAMNMVTDIKKPWTLSFSFGRALQVRCLLGLAAGGLGVAEARRHTPCATATQMPTQ